MLFGSCSRIVPSPPPCPRRALDVVRSPRVRDGSGSPIARIGDWPGAPIDRVRIRVRAVHCSRFELRIGFGVEDGYKHRFVSRHSHEAGLGVMRS